MLFWCWPGQPPMGNGLDYTLGDGHGGSRASRIDRSSNATARNATGEETTSSTRFRSEHPKVEAMLRSVAAGAGRARDDHRSEEELSMMA